MKRVIAVLLAVCLLSLGVFAAGNFLDGTWYGTAMGRNGWISVSVEVENGSIAEIQVDAPEETPGKLAQAMQIVDRMIGCEDLAHVQAVDAISGATGSSEGIKNAVLNALQGAIPAWLHSEGEACPGAAFTDLPAVGDWAHTPIDWAVTTGVTTGTDATHFSPGAFCTRAQVVTFLYRAAHAEACRGDHWSPAGGQCPPLRTENGAAAVGDGVLGVRHTARIEGSEAEGVRFTDVTADAYYYDAVLWAVENGVTNGTDATHFSPNAPCTRAQVVTFLYRASHAEACRGDHWSPAGGQCPPLRTENGAAAVGDGSLDVPHTARFEGSEAEGVRFTDVTADAYYYDAVLWAVENGVTNGTDATHFSPNAPCTRAQVVTFLYRARSV